MIKISKHLSYSEVKKSYTASKNGINNSPSNEQLSRIIDWARNIFDPTREYIDTPLGCASIYRSKKLNKLIGGNSTSQHMADNGACGDIDGDIYGNTTNEIIFNYIKDNLDFDQMIIEGLQDGRIQWVHCSYVSPEKNRNEILMMYVNETGTHYEKYNLGRFHEIIKIYTI